MAKDDRLVRTLLKSTKANEITWKEVESKAHKFFTEFGENIENAYFYHIEKKKNNIIIYKAFVLVTDPDIDEQYEKANIHVVFTEENSFKSKYKISDYELDDSSHLWILYKQIQRQTSGVDSIIQGLIDDLNPLDF